MKKANNGIYLICLIVAIAVTIIAMAFSSKKDVEEYQQLQQSIDNTQNISNKVEEGLNQVNDSLQSGYDNLDKGIDY